MSTHDFDEWINEFHPKSKTTSAYVERTVIMPTDNEVKAMRAVVADAVTLFAKNRGRIHDADCFADKDRDWQLALSDAVVLRDHPTLQDCSVSDAIYFMRMTETGNSDPMVFVVGVVGTPTPTSFFPYAFKFWSAVPPGWKGSDAANARCTYADAERLAQFFMACVDESNVNQMPGLEIDEGVKEEQS
jgi:hypothetical protein